MTNKRILTLITLLLFLLLLVGCKTTNQAPIITSIPITTAIVGVEYVYEVKATDPDGDTLTYSLTVKPGGMAINATTGIINWTPALVQIGSKPVTVKVSDGKKFTTQSFTITVNAVEPDPEIELTGIKVDPKTMTLFVGESEAIKSVTAIYEIRGFGVPIPLGYCTYDLVGETVITVSDDGVVMAVGEGTADIVVSYKGKFDTVEVTVKVAIIIDGILSPGEWDGATVIPVADGMGTVRVLADVDYLYVSFYLKDSNDARTQYAVEVGNDQISINVNPTDGYDLIFETSALSGGNYLPDDGGHHQLPWNPKINSGTSDDNWATRWFPNDNQQVLPSDLESATEYSGGRITEWKLPLDFMSVLLGDVLKVGGAVDVGDGNSYRYPIGLLWGNASTFVDIVVY